MGVLAARHGVTRQLFSGWENEVAEPDGATFCVSATNAGEQTECYRRVPRRYDDGTKAVRVDDIFSVDGVTLERSMEKVVIHTCVIRHYVRLGFNSNPIGFGLECI